MIVYHQNNVAAFAGNSVYYFLPQQIIISRVSVTTVAAPGRIMSSLAAAGGLAAHGGIAGEGGGLAG